MLTRGLRKFRVSNMRYNTFSSSLWGTNDAPKSELKSRSHVKKSEEHVSTEETSRNRKSIVKNHFARQRKSPAKPTEFDILQSETKRCLRSMNILEPTEIQSIVIPKFQKFLRKFEALGHKNQREGVPNTGMPSMIIHSVTGSGKTLAYLLPIIDHLVGKWSSNRFGKSVHTVILVASPELGVQLNDVVTSLFESTCDRIRRNNPKAPKNNLSSLLIDEVFVLQNQLEEVLDGNCPSIIVTTPSMWLNAIKLDTGKVITSVETAIDDITTIPSQLRDIKCVIVDEADATLKPPTRYAPLKKRDLRSRKPKTGEQALDSLMQQGQPSLVLVSASVNSQLKRMVLQRGWASENEIVQTSIMGKSAFMLPKTIQHIMVPIDANPKDSEEFTATVAETIYLLHRNLKQEPGLVIAPGGFPTKQLHGLLKSLDISSLILHEYLDSSKSPRENLQRLREDIDKGDSNLVISNSVSIRGIDFPSLRNVYLIHGNSITDVEYIHGAGRVGRMGKTGKAISILPQSMTGKFKQMGNRLQFTVQAIE